MSLGFKFVSNLFVCKCLNKWHFSSLSSVWCRGETEQITHAVLCSLMALQPHMSRAHNFSHMPKL